MQVRRIENEPQGWLTILPTCLETWNWLDGIGFTARRKRLESK